MNGQVSPIDEHAQKAREALADPAEYEPKEAPLTADDVRDYDALTSERKPFKAKIGGRVITLPLALPAKIWLDARRKFAGRDPDAWSSEERMDFGFQAIETVLTEEEWNHVGRHLDIDQLTSFVIDVFGYYGIGSGKAEGAEPAREVGTEEGMPPQDSRSHGTTVSDSSAPSTPISSGSTPEHGSDSTTAPRTGEPSEKTSSSTLPPSLPALHGYPPSPLL